MPNAPERRRKWIGDTRSARVVGSTRLWHPELSFLGGMVHQALHLGGSSSCLFKMACIEHLQHTTTKPSTLNIIHFTFYPCKHQFNMTNHINVRISNRIPVRLPNPHQYWKLLGVRHFIFNWDPGLRWVCASITPHAHDTLGNRQNTTRWNGFMVVASAVEFCALPSGSSLLWKWSHQWPQQLPQFMAGFKGMAIVSNTNNDEFVFMLLWYLS